MNQKSSTPVGPSGKVMDFIDVGIGFDELTFEGHLYRFGAEFKVLDTPVRGVTVARGGTFSLDSRSTGLPKGTRMTWVTK